MTGVQAYLQGRGVPFLVLPLPEAATPAETARAHGIDQGEMVRCIVLMTRVGPTLAAIPADRELDLDRAREVLTDPDAQVATPEDLERHFPDFDPDALPPVGLFFLVPMVVDPDVLLHEQLVFPSGRRTSLLCVERDDLFRDDVYLIAPITRESASAGEPDAAVEEDDVDEDDVVGEPEITDSWWRPADTG